MEVSITIISNNKERNLIRKKQNKNFFPYKFYIVAEYHFDISISISVTSFRLLFNTIHHKRNKG